MSNQRIENSLHKIEIDTDINDKVLQTTGITQQSTIYMEELAELIQIIAKIKRYGMNKEILNNLYEEMADVLICVQQMIEAYGLDVKNINSWIKYKQVKATQKNFKLSN